MDVLMIGPKTFGNVGFVARCMKNFGAGQLIVLGPRYENVDDIKGFAMHGRDVLDGARVLACDEVDVAREFGTIARDYEVVVGTTAKMPHRRKLYRVPVEPHAAATRLASTKSLLVLGREDTGLADAELKLCDVLVTIPASPDYPTMNVSHAAAIVMYEYWLARPPLAASHEKPFSTVATEEFFPASRASRQEFHEWFSRAVSTKLAWVTDDWRVENFITSVRNVLERAPVTARELAIIGGFLKRLESRSR